jgi:nucleoside-diphosphate-sugar epimerase
LGEDEGMSRIAVIGAGGQVGAEVTLLLSNHSGHSFVPVCRNRSGSAFLRYFGIPCWHSVITEPESAYGLLGDCDIVANFALSKSPFARENRTINNQIIKNSIKYSAKDAKIIYFSTMAVYGSPRPEVFFSWPSAYGREKLHGERLAIRMGWLYGKQIFVLRLGHVSGDLQNITNLIREIIKRGPVCMPNSGRNLSNTVYTATVAEAIINIASGLEQPGIYDLMCVPQWTWREVYEYEASRIGRTLQVKNIEGPKRKRVSTLIKSLPGRFMRGIVNSVFFKEATNKVLSRMPENLNMRIRAVYSKAKVKAEIAGLLSHQMVDPALSLDPVGDKFLVSLSETGDLLKKEKLFRLPEWDSSKAFPPDIPNYMD